MRIMTALRIFPATCRKVRLLSWPALVVALILATTSLKAQIAPSRGFYQRIDEPTGLDTLVRGVSDNGYVVGACEGCGPNVWHGFVMSPNGSFAIFDGWPSDVNDAGWIVGSSNTGAFVLVNGTYTSIGPSGAASSSAGGINDNGWIAGTYTDSLGTHGFLLVNGVYTRIDFPLASFTTCSGIADNGTIVCTAKDGLGTWFAFLYDNGTFTRIDFPAGTAMSPSGPRVGAIASDATGVSFVANFRDSAGVKQLAVCRYDFRYVRQKGVWSSFSGVPASWGLTYSLEGINSGGQIVGTHLDSVYGYISFLYTPRN